MKKMMTLITAVVFTMIAFAATEKVDGYTWSYRLNGNSAEIYTDDFSKAAVSPKPTGALTIPSSLGGKTVTSIGNYALRDCSGITNVIIPDGVTEIKSAAFSGCTGLTGVAIPDSVISFGFNAFASCSGLIAFVVGENNPAYCSVDGLILSKDGSYLVEVPENRTNVTIPNSVTCIGVKAFGFGTKLVSVEVPSGVSSIENGAFAQCEGLLKVIFKGDAPTTVGQSVFPDRCVVCVSRQAKGFEVDKSGKWHYATVEYYGPEFVIDKNGKLTSVTLHDATIVEIPDGVTSIGDEAFYNCSGMSSVLIPSSVKSIGYNSFDGCSGLASVHIVDLCAWCEIDFVNTHGDTYPRSNPLTYAHNLYLNGERVTSLIIPNSVTKIKNDAFSCCSSLTSVTIPNGVTSIGASAFIGCSGLKKVVLPNQVVDIGNSAFRDCSGIMDLTIPKGVTSIAPLSFSGCSGMTSVSLPDSVINIGSSAFSHCTSLTNLVIPAGVESVGNSSFYGCSGLMNVDIPDGVLNIGDSAFRGCSSLVSVTIPKSLTSIDHCVFSDCSSLTNVALPESLITIGSMAFSACSGLTGLKIPGSVTSIGSSAFTGCSGLTSVNIPYGVITIGGSAFASCTSLKNVVIPDSVTNIGANAFSNCGALLTVSVPQYVFDKKLTTTFPSSYWMLTNVCVAAGVTNISDNAFNYCSSIKSFGVLEGNTSFKSDNGLLLSKDGATLVHGVVGSVIVPECVAVIGNYAFYGCDGLVSVMLPNGVTTIGDYAFYACKGLRNVTIPDSVTLIGYQAFCLCTELTNVKIGRGVESIGGWAFSNDGKLNSVAISQYCCSLKLANIFKDSYQTISVVEISEDVTIINRDLFAGCTSIKKVVAPIGLNEEIVEALNDSIDGVEFVWTNAPTGGDGNWRLCQTEVHSGTVSWRSGTISHDQQTWLEMNVETPGRLSFWWKASSESEGADIYDYAYLSIDGLRQGSRIVNADSYRLNGIAIGGKTEWTKVEIDVSGSGQHKIRWTYCKDDVDEAYVGDDCVWLDDIVWTPLVCVSFDIGGAEGVTPADVVQLSGTSVLLPDNSGFKRDGYIFSGWSDGVKAYGAGESFELPCDNVKLNAIWIRKSVLTFTLAEGCGTAPESISGVPGTKVFLPLAIGFSRDCYTFEGWNDGLRTYDVGEQYEIGDKDVAFAAVWSAKTQTAPTISSVDVENGGEIESEHATIAMTADDGSTIHYTLDGSDPTVQSLVYTVPFVADGMSVVIKAIAVKDDYFDSNVATFSFTRKPYSLAECIGMGGADVATGGNTGWQRILGGEAHDGVAALKSNAIGDGQTNWVQVTVFGAGTVSFWWKVSCEGTNRGKRRDGCVFMVDGQESKYTDGTTNDWTEVRVEVLGSGEHKLKWAYGKNNNGTFAGYDCAWLDSVVWTPKNAVTTLDDLAKIFGCDSLVVEHVNDEIQLAVFNNFLRGCSVTSAADLTSGQKQYAYQSFKLSEITTTPQLFEEEPVLKIDDFELAGDNLSVTISLTAGAEAIQLAKDKLAEKIRVGTSIDAIITPPNILVSPSVDGMLLTYTIIPPQGNQVFVKVQID